MSEQTTGIDDTTAPAAATLLRPETLDLGGLLLLLIRP